MTVDHFSVVAQFDQMHHAALATAERLESEHLASRTTFVLATESHGLEYLRALATAEAFGWAAAVLHGEAAGGTGYGSEQRDRLRYIVDIASEKISECIDKNSLAQKDRQPDRIAAAIAAVRHHETIVAWHLLMSTAKSCQPQRM